MKNILIYIPIAEYAAEFAHAYVNGVGREEWKKRWRSKAKLAIVSDDYLKFAAEDPHTPWFPIYIMRCPEETARALKRGYDAIKSNENDVKQNAIEYIDEYFAGRR